MGTDPTAKLFYGYLQPEDDRENYNEHSDEDDFDTPWTMTHTKTRQGCIGDIYGYGSSLGFFLAVKETLYYAGWDRVIKLTPERFTILPEWDEQLKGAAKEFGLNIADQLPGWHLVCLYF